MRPRGCFGVVLDAEGGKIFVPNSSNGVIVQISVSDFEAVRKGFFSDRKTVILGGYFDASGSAVEHGLVRTAVPKL